MARLGAARLQLHLREEGLILLRHLSSTMACSVSDGDDVLRHLLILGLNLSDVQLLGIVINMASSGLVLFLRW